MVKISLTHSDRLVEIKTPNQADAHKCVISSEKYRQVLTNKIRIHPLGNGQRGQQLPQNTEYVQQYKSHLDDKRLCRDVHQVITWIQEQSAAPQKVYFLLQSNYSR